MSKERAAQLIDAGIWLRLSGDLDGARKLFERALKLDPSNERAPELLGEGPAAPESRPASVDESPFEPPAAPPMASSPSMSTLAAESAMSEALTADEMDWGKATGFESPTPFAPPSESSTAESEPAPPFSSTPSTISIGGGVSEVPARSTPPIYYAPSGSQRAPLTVTLDGEGPPPSPIRATPPQFVEAPPPSRPVPPQADPSPPANEWRPPFAPPEPPSPVVAIDVPLTPNPDPVGVAWAWSSNSPAPFRDSASQPVVPAESRPLPQPSPLSPNATSAWDARSNPGIKLSAIVGEARALEMLSSDSAVHRAAPPPDARAEVKTLLRGARDLLDLDDHTGAMELIVKAQQLAPDDADAKALRERSERTLLTMFESKLGKLETIPRVLLKEDEIIWLNLDHRAGFVLAQIDGTVSFDDLFAVSGMSRLDTARILAQLVDEGVINKG